MSFDLAVWFPERRLSDGEAGRLYNRLCDGKTESISPNPAVDAFYEALTAKHPEIGAVPDRYAGDIDFSPWSIAFDRSSSHLLLSCVWPKADYVAQLVLGLAQELGLAVFDPQLDIALYPDNVEFARQSELSNVAPLESHPPKPARLRLAADGDAPVAAASFAVVKRALHMLGPRRHAFVVLERGQSYVQSAGDRERLTVEFRQHSAPSFTHSVLGRAPASDTLDRIEYRHGSIKVQANEVLGLADAVGVFRCFYASGTVPPDYLCRDVTAMFN